MGTAHVAQSLVRPEHRALGESVSEVWSQLLRHTDRFVSLDSSVFFDLRSTSVAYPARYGVTA